MARGETNEKLDFRNSMILNLRNQRDIMEQRVFDIDRLISLVESDEKVVEFARIMGEMQQPPQGR